MLMLSLTQILLAVPAIAFSAAASVLILRRDGRAPLWMVVAGATGLVFFLTFNPLRFEMLAPILLLAAGVVMMMPGGGIDDALDEFDLGESTATRRRR